MQEECSHKGEEQVQSWEHVCGVQKLMSPVCLYQSRVAVTGARSRPDLEGCGEEFILNRVR